MTPQNNPSSFDWMRDRSGPPYSINEKFTNYINKKNRLSFHIFPIYKYLLQFWILHLVTTIIYHIFLLSNISQYTYIATLRFPIMPGFWLHINFLRLHVHFFLSYFPSPPPSYFCYLPWILGSNYSYNVFGGTVWVTFPEVYALMISKLN